MCDYLQNLGKDDIVKIGIKLGLNSIKLNDLDGNSFCHRMLEMWLSQQDYVKKISGKPTRQSLFCVLEKLGYHGNADLIKERLNL